jgi:predicted phage tail protein
MNNENENARLQSRQIAGRINWALGLFLLFFGLVVLSAVFFTPGVAGKLTNALCAAILTSVGVGMIARSRVR